MGWKTLEEALAPVCTVCEDDGDDEAASQSNVMNGFRSLGEQRRALQMMCPGPLAQLWSFASVI